VVSAQIGFLSLSVAKQFAIAQGHGLLGQLDDVATTCVSKFNELRVTGQWVGTANKASSFTASSSRLPSSSVPYVRGMSRADWLRWFDAHKNCLRCGKDGHPPKYCGDAGARDRTKEEWRAIWKKDKDSRQGGGKRQGRPAGPRPNPRFRSAEAKSNFKKTVVKAYLNSVRDEDREYLAHMAADLGGEDVDDGEEEQIYAALAGDEDATAVDEDVTTQDDDEDEAHALAALSIDQLLNW
jgi:hypothetical protein